MSTTGTTEMFWFNDELHLAGPGGRFDGISTGRARELGYEMRVDDRGLHLERKHDDGVHVTTIYEFVPWSAIKQHRTVTVELTPKQDAKAPAKR